MKPWIRTALAVALMLAIAAGGFFLPNLVAARLDRAEQDTAFSLSTGDEQGPATVLRRKLTDGMQNLFYGAEDPVELDESAAAHTASFLLDDATGCVLALSYTFSDSYAFQIRQNDLWDYLLRVFETRVGATVAAALGVPYDEVQIPMPEAAKKMLGLRTSGGNTVPLQLLNAGNEGSYNDGMDSSITDYLQFYDPDADTAFSLPAWRVENTLYFNAQ